METPDPTKAILDWAEGCHDWQRDALRRLAGKANLDKDDLDELMALILAAVGLLPDLEPPDPVALNTTHLASGVTAPKVKINAIRNIKNVNTLAKDAGLIFDSDRPTVIYGANGSGKTGYIRIFRSACRTRIENPETLSILSNVYGPAVTAPKQAEIVVSISGREKSIHWEANGPANPLLSRVSVFDSDAASIYVMKGNHIEFLPFNLDLPLRLKEVCVTLKTRLEQLQQTVAKTLPATELGPFPEKSLAGEFYQNLTATTPDAAIDKTANMTKKDRNRLEELRKILVGSRADVVALRGLAQWAESRSTQFMELGTGLSKDNVSALYGLAAERRTARIAADQSAKAAFTGEPLNGVGSETWRRMWQAARDYSMTEAYIDETFPVTTPLVGESSPRCVLCQQPLEDGAARLERFHAFIEGTLATAADEADRKLTAALNTFRALPINFPEESDDRLLEIEEFDSGLAKEIRAWREAATEQHKAVLNAIENDGLPDGRALNTAPIDKLNALAASLRLKADNLQSALADDGRQKLETEKQELEARQKLAESREQLKNRRNLLKQKAAYDRAIKLTTTTGITRRAGELLDEFLTTTVKRRFEAEREALDIMHLSVGMERKSAPIGADYEPELGATIRCRTTKVLSDGEQRALALAAFLTETGIAVPDGPIIIDDPVSSLDDGRMDMVAQRLASEAKKRQVIVFTHSLEFFNQLCSALRDENRNPTDMAIFRHRASGRTGIVDPFGEPWKGKSVKKRLNVLKQKVQELKKLEEESQSEYSIEAKGIYGRLRDAYERFVEEHLFHEVVNRFRQGVQTTQLRYVAVPDPIVERFHEGFTKASKHSHDNSRAGSVVAPPTDEISQDIEALEQLFDDVKIIHKATKEKRLYMKP